MALSLFLQFHFPFFLSFLAIEGGGGERERKYAFVCLYSNKINWFQGFVCVCVVYTIYNQLYTHTPAAKIAQQFVRKPKRKSVIFENVDFNRTFGLYIFCSSTFEWLWNKKKNKWGGESVSETNFHVGPVHLTLTLRHTPLRQGWRNMVGGECISRRENRFCFVFFLFSRGLSGSFGLFFCFF